MTVMIEFCVVILLINFKKLWTVRKTIRVMKVKDLTSFFSLECKEYGKNTFNCDPSAKLSKFELNI